MMPTPGIVTMRWPGRRGRETLRRSSDLIAAGPASTSRTVRHCGSQQITDSCLLSTGIISPFTSISVRHADDTVGLLAVLQGSLRVVALPSYGLPDQRLAHGRTSAVLAHATPAKLQMVGHLSPLHDKRRHAVRATFIRHAQHQRAGSCVDHVVMALGRLIDDVLPAPASAPLQLA